MRHQSARLQPLGGERADLPIRRGDVRGEMIVQRLQMRAPVGGAWRQRQSGQRRLTKSTPQGRAPEEAVRQGQSLERVLHACPHPHPLITVEQGAHIGVSSAGIPGRGGSDRR